MTKHITRSVVGTVAGMLLAAPLALMSPVSAAPAAHRLVGEASLSIPDVVIYSGACAEHPLTYSVAPDPAFPNSWNLKTDVFRPDGSNSSYGFIGSTTGTPAPSTGSATMQYCGNLDAPGTYTASTRFQYETRNSFQTVIFSTSLVVRYPATQTSLAMKNKVKKGRRVTAKVTTLAERPGSYVPAKGSKVRVQFLKGTAWKNIKRATGRIGKKGKASITFRFPAKGDTQLRAVTTKSPNATPSTSAVIVRKG
ncbi:MAG: hypothetical protein H0X12_18945 [Nocardioides sp.]|nr:hypothetical protein [Nocardioides sp.]